MSASLYGRRWGSIRTWQRSAMACTVAPVVSSIRSRAVSWGAAAYGSATMSSAVKVSWVMTAAPGAGLLRASTAAKKSSMACRTSLPPSKPRQSSRSRPTSS